VAKDPKEILEMWQKGFGTERKIKPIVEEPIEEPEDTVEDRFEILDL
jgi:hypothetical protein